ncbi:MAG TPA: glycosyltransferase family 39 protein, partial [Polyangiaceae bacterium]|nr:glycosyltransferase family 39 protein [Polyangiaceae bacterium]
MDARSMSNPSRATGNRSTEPSTGHWGWLVFVLCCVGLFLRVLNAHADLGTPHVDENAIVVQAVAFMGGEWRYYLLEYGPLPMYLLAGVYHLLARAHGLSAMDYASRVFFDYEEQYFVARLFCAASYVVLALAAYRVFAPRFGRWAAAVSSLLLSFPCLDVLTASKARVDVPQGACQVAGLLCLCLALDSGRLRYWLLAGLAAGGAFACKPMPALLIAPCFLAASWFASEAEVI